MNADDRYRHYLCEIKLILDSDDYLPNDSELLRLLNLTEAYRAGESMEKLGEEWTGSTHAAGDVQARVREAMCALDALVPQGHPKRTLPEHLRAWRDAAS